LHGEFLLVQREIVVEDQQLLVFRAVGVEEKLVENSFSRKK
jgi:hypothetical protein